ncbi:hypothetical protein [Arthrobacter silvisoli]|uniref:hypothetical protein n=1 Tax=Arthrobacter silvisoli TaxID=2291022 RepID=UPI000E20E4B0|nr:hypothetical protein [Arthrobacter silvisoli]
MGDTNAALHPLLIASVLVFTLTGTYWGRFRFPMLKSGGAADERLGRINFVLVGLQGVLATTLPFANGNRGFSLLAFTASTLFFAALGIYRLKRPDLRLSRYAGTGSHADTDALKRPTTRWPYTLTYMLGYFALFAYFGTLGLR